VWSAARESNSPVVAKSIGLWPRKAAASLLDLSPGADDPLIDALEEFNAANTDSMDVPLMSRSS